ncbi:MULTISPECIES: helix-turn-helix domain-containing protein [unclassified Streptomyces]|uniref:helix-turn-helix domain-containing protein n=1 Tax=unclassified Streptomyces TaxID=2593676 RepID=UPI000DAF2EBE|nr:MULTISPECIES: helix-turn-helix transcriptional regulator [unclassified Streptomyces]PZT74368.1 XRE family transcriptional regulator [Streptomyces sp. AC1-42T]PZT82642.1 XRE family transcriptional regulator [Streptomyces sp. AC1-42W]
MPNVRPIPTVRRRRLGEALRRYRNSAGMSLDTASAALGWIGPKLSRIETANGHIRPAEVAALLESYGVKDPEVVSALEGLAKDARKQGWWQTYSGIVAPAYADYISLESDAATIHEFAPLLIPGLLQTASYARETIAANATTRTTEEVAALAEVRQARQAVLTRPQGTLKFWAVIHEAVLHQRFAIRPDTIREQLRRLLDVTDLPNVTLQILPLQATPNPGGAGAFSLVGFPGPMPDVVLLENLIGATYVEGVDDVRTFADAFERIVAAALPVDDSLALIARMEERHRK